MIRKLLRKVFTPKAAARPKAKAEGAVIPLAAHGIRREMVSPAARKVCSVLQEAGFTAYVVGGAVRDLIARIDPKDFDVATSATPEEVRHLFRRSRIIGRRFRIVHVMSGPETIEVSTYRALHDDDTETDEHGRVLRDNVWGCIEDDATRRDFTVNALYYDPTTETVLDFHHGVADLKQKTMRVIGEPAARYREDPVRMLRAVRLAAKLDLILDPAARKPIRELAELLQNVPAARLFDEMLKLLASGYAVVSLKRLRDEGLHHGLLPLLDVILEQPLGEKFVWLALENTDARVRAGKPISPGFLFACLLWHEVLANWTARKANKQHSQPALFEAMDEVLASQAEKLAITRRIAGDITEIWALQPRFEKRAGKAPFRLIEQPRFRAGYDFLRLRAESGEIDIELPDWWDEFAKASTEEREAMLVPEKKGEGAARKRRRPRKKSAGESSGSPARRIRTVAVLAWVGLGANLGDPIATIREALAALGQLPESRVVACSSLYRTAPVGPGTEGQPDYINAVALLDTTLAAPALLNSLLALEHDFGRERGARNAARTLDLDLLLYGHEILESPGLHVPHPRMHERAFVLIPLCELAPETHIPGHGPAMELLDALADAHITRIPDSVGAASGRELAAGGRSYKNPADPQE